MPGKDPIRHVVLLMLENRSFDQMLGGLKELFPALEGVDPAKPHANKAPDGTPYPQRKTEIRRMDLDPKHERKNVRTQLLHGNAGFVIDFVDAYKSKATPERIRGVMGYYERGTLPALQQLAEHFTVCDHWHASVPGPTWTNRLFALSGTSLGRVAMPDLLSFEPNLHRYDQDTIFDRLDERGVSWAVFHGDVPLSLLLEHQRKLANLARYHGYEDFAELVDGPEADFPSFALVEPDYLGSSANDDHPPHDIVRGQNLIADVYNTLRRNPALWASTLLVVLYDEHGGFYDHVVPPAAEPPDDHHEEYHFEQLGLRVPALLVSPWVARAISSTTFDHTSLLRYLIDKWSLGELGKRTATANSIVDLIAGSGALRTDYPDALFVGEPMPATPAPALSDHEKAVVALAESLEKGKGVSKPALAAKVVMRGARPAKTPRFAKLKPEKAREAARRSARHLIESARAAAAPGPRVRARKKSRAREAPEQLPRGLRNNNPGNVRKGAPWRGLAETQPDPEFCTFVSLAFGVRAIARILRSYAGRGIDTLRAFAANWAPGSDGNDPLAFARRVLRECAGQVATIDSRVDLTDDTLRFNVIRGIVVMENGARWSPRVSDEVILEGIRLEAPEPQA